MRVLAPAVLFVALALAPSAIAGGAGQGPVNPAVSQYVEMIPTASGQRPVATQAGTPASGTQTETTSPATTPATTAPVVTPPATRAAVPSTGTAHRTAPNHPSAHRHRLKPAATPTAQTQRARALPAVAAPSFATAAVGSAGTGGAWLVVLLIVAALAPLAIFGAQRRS